MTELIKMDGLDKALIGRSCIWDSSGRQEDRLIYSGEKIVAILMARDGMTPEEANESLWDYQPICIGLDDGTTLIPVSDDEMNQAGSIFHHNAEESTIPVMRERL